MLLGTAVTLAAIPLYYLLRERQGVVGLAWAGVAGMSASALLTLVLARSQHGGPPFAALAASSLRALCIAAIAGALGHFAGELASALDPAPVVARLLVGGGVFTVAALGGLALFGDAPSKRLLERLRTKLGGRR